MANHNTPKYLFIKAVVTMNHKISCIDDFSSRTYFYACVNFQNTVYSFANNSDIPFNKSQIYYIFTKHLITATPKLCLFHNFSYRRINIM